MPKERKRAVQEVHNRANRHKSENPRKQCLKYPETRADHELDEVAHEIDNTCERKARSGDKGRASS